MSEREGRDYRIGSSFSSNGERNIEEDSSASRFRYTKNNVSNECGTQGNISYNKTEFESSNSESDYIRWKYSYLAYLIRLYEIFSKRIYSFKTNLCEKISFEDFSLFVYKNSSGYISNYL